MRAADFLGPWEEDQSARSLPRLMTHHWRRMLIVHLKTLTVKKTVRKKHFSNRGQWPESERVKYPGLWPVTRYKKHSLYSKWSDVLMSKCVSLKLQILSYNIRIWCRWFHCILISHWWVFRIPYTLTFAQIFE